MLWMSTVSKHSSFRSVCTTCFVVSIWTIIYLALGAFPSILVWTIQNGTLILLADPSLTACPGFSLVFLFLFLMLLLSFPLAGPFSHSVCTLYSSDLRLLASVLTCRQSLFYCFTVNCFFFFPLPQNEGLQQSCIGKVCCHCVFQHHLFTSCLCLMFW